MTKKKSVFTKLLFIVIFAPSPLSVFISSPPISRSSKKKTQGKPPLWNIGRRNGRGRGRNTGYNKHGSRIGRYLRILLRAVLIGEDDKFWQHEGFDYEAMQKAIEKDIKAKKFKLGGSTISQQLAKNLYLSPSRIR